MREFIVSEDFHPNVRGYRELTRCKDCRWGHIADRETPIIYDRGCPYHKLISKTYGNWFCADGEPKD